MTDTEILDTISDEEMACAIKRECVEVDGAYLLRLLYPDGTVKYVRNLAVPVKDDETSYEIVDETLGHMDNLRCELLKSEVISDGYRKSCEIAARPDATGTWEECKPTGKRRLVIDWIDPKMRSEYKKWKAESDHEPEILDMDHSCAVMILVRAARDIFDSGYLPDDQHEELESILKAFPEATKD